MKIISLGVGVQTAGLYYMSSMGFIERCDYAIFADTGGEKTHRKRGVANQQTLNKLARAVLETNTAAFNDQKKRAQKCG